MIPVTQNMVWAYYVSCGLRGKFRLTTNYQYKVQQKWLKVSTFLLLDSWVRAESGLTLTSVGLADSDSDSGPMDSDSDSDSGPMDSDSRLMDSDSGLMDSDSDSGLVDSDSLPDSRVRTHSNTGNIHLNSSNKVTAKVISNGWRHMTANFLKLWCYYWTGVLKLPRYFPPIGAQGGLHGTPFRKLVSRWNFVMNTTLYARIFIH